MRFTFKQLRYFDAALRHGSIARAADEMNISQSSITAAIDMIEATLGTRLFRRTPAKGIMPTETGRTVGERIAAFLEQCQSFDSSLAVPGADPTGTLRLACYAPTAPFVLPLLLKQVSSLYPAIRIDLKEGDMSVIADLLQRGVVEMALTYRRYLRPSQPFVPFFRARPFALLPESSPLAARASLSLEDLADQPMIMLDLPATQNYFRQLFSSQGLKPQVVHSTKSSSVLRGLVAANLGYSLLNIVGRADRDPDSGYVVRPLTGDLEAPEYGLAYARGAETTPVVKAVLRICQNPATRKQFEGLTLSVSPNPSLNVL
ncbi:MULTISPECIES: LysR family transcriptional regulator [Roseobacteraceae]|uniref:HTH-type transcriptional activator CmpR n=1 Tax=Pseudosulfitobacter pseudonitzschiae TaxID=1402135 RepID=A0A221K1P3_9RHOB|nr:MULTISPECIES: LysR family transcriptional regulator [Roseobacteraceae]ASM72905.1 HTH-type transcriptional activator CmpR [Pseudosulfitobacter pseudonitzschiae]